MSDNKEAQEVTWKDRLVKMRDTALKAFYHPTVIKVSRFATDVLEATYVVDPKNPLSIGSAAVALVDSAVTAFELPQPTKLDHFAESRELVQFNGSLPKVMMEAKINTMHPTKTVLKLDGNMVVKEVSLDDKNKIYYIENVDSTTSFTDPVDRIYYLFYTTKDFEFEKVFDAIWNFYTGGIFLAKTSTATNPQGTIKLNSLTSSDYMYIGDLSIDDFATDIIKCRAENLSRSFMLVGPPGCGKSSFSINVAQKVSNRILKVDPSAARMFGSVEFDFLIKNLRPDVIIFDDFDRAALAHDSEHLLFLLENIKNQNPHLVIFATVNEFYRLDKALVRPGRFDEIIWFDEPSASARQRVIEAYLNKYAIAHDKEIIKSILDKTVGMSPVYIKELCLRMKRKGPSCIDAVINEFKRSMQNAGDNDEFMGLEDLGDNDEVSDGLDELDEKIANEELDLCIQAQVKEALDELDSGSKFSRIVKKKRRRRKSENKSMWTIPRS